MRARRVLSHNKLVRSCNARRVPRTRYRVKPIPTGLNVALFLLLLQEGERGYLEGLASRYADLFRTHYGDVLEPLEELRRRETNASSRMPNTQLTTSHSQPIYVPGKYSVSKSLILAVSYTPPSVTLRRFLPPLLPPRAA